MDYLEGAGRKYLESVSFSYNSSDSAGSSIGYGGGNFIKKIVNMCRNTCRMFGSCTCGGS